jgi:hypothetical protein
MDDHANKIEALFGRVTDYGKTSLELVKLKTVEKTSDVFSTFIPHAVVFTLFAIFLLFLSIGLAIWIGGLLDNIFYGFFIVAAFYGIVGAIVHFLMHKWIKRVVTGFIIKLSLK